MTTLRETPLTGWHRKHGAKLVEFAGYEMPLRYAEGVIAEHNAVRERCGIFDVSHMGEIEVTGPTARASVDRLVTNDVAKLEAGQVLYSAMCRESGTVIDDVLVYCFDDHRFGIVCNASNQERVLAWIVDHVEAPDQVVDRSETTALFALQGPRSLDVLRAWPRLAGARSSVEALDYYRFVPVEAEGANLVISRTGYTGEKGYEIYVDAEQALGLWQELVDCGAEHGLTPAGLGARDTLRLEAGYSLYGHELDDETTPYEAGIGWVVKLKAGDFIGRDVLAEQKANGVERRTIALATEGRNIPREGAPVLAEGSVVGKVTSGSFSPTLQHGIGLARVDASAVDADLSIDLRGRSVPAQKVKLPFVPARVRD